MMTKGDFCKYLAQKEGVSVSQATSVVDSVLSAMKECLKNNKKLAFRNSFTLEVVKQPAKSGKVGNHEYTTPEKNKVKFTASKDWKDAVQ